MATDKIPASFPGTTSLFVRPPNKIKPTEPPCPSVSASQAPSKESAPETGKVVKARKLRKKVSKSKPPKNTTADMEVKENVKQLHDHTKRVKSKLAKMKQTLPQGHNAKKGNLTEGEIILEIRRLKELVKELRLERVAVQEKVQKKDDHIDIEDEDDDQVKDLKPVAKPTSKVGRRKIREKPKQQPQELGDSAKLHAAFEKHINRIVSGANANLTEWVNLKYVYGENLEDFAQKCVDAGLGQVVEGKIRVNAKNNHQSFISVDDGPDAMMSSMEARMYTMEGDRVRVFVRNEPDSSTAILGDADESIDEGLEGIVDECGKVQNEFSTLDLGESNSPSTRRHAFVISVVEQKGNRMFVGTISLKNPVKADFRDYYKFRPRDMKVPMIYIAVESCKDIVATQKSDDIMGLLYVAEITTIKDNGRCVGVLREPIGKCGHLESEIKAVLLNNGLKDVKPYAECYELLFSPNTDITYDEMEGRIDLRNECIFTIDPLTARDLDDAVSCKQLENGYFEVGVHISDVTAYLRECSELDELVKMRATSIYLANEVIHMLPMSLCHKCSLLPGEEKLAFSVFWVMNEQGKIKSTRFTRSIIRSCTQLAYEHAQKIIDNPKEQFTYDDFPTICGKFTVKDIVTRVHRLHKIAEYMRKRRFLNGCLSLDRPEFYFQFDPKTGEPTDFETVTRSSANFLIEEFMLQANQSVAHFIYKRFPDIAFLRNHQPPKQNALNNLKAKLSAVGIELNVSTSKTIHEGLKKICAASSDPEVISAGLNHLLAKPMLRSKYFCSSATTTPADLFHYALAIPIYTHFTSPIRRYPDIIVHRLLAAALDYEPAPMRTSDELSVLAQICNEQKLNAKNASDESANLFFSRYVKARKSLKLRAVVTDIYRHSMEVLTLKTGRLITLQYKMQKVIVDASAAPAFITIAENHSTKPPLELRLFSPVDISLVVVDGKLTGLFVSPDSEQRLKNSIIEGQKLHENKPRRVRRRAVARKVKLELDKSIGDH